MVVGSFLNVVIYRLPHGLSVLRPLWSFCPHCRHRIRPIHNIPVLSWLCLGERCFYCRAPISVIYPVIECASCLIFVAVWDAMFTARVVPGVSALDKDWAMALAYLVLFSGLLAGAAMDIESYVIDIRICVFTVLVGLIGQGLWWADAKTLEAPFKGGLPTALPPALSLTGVVMGATWLITCFVASRFTASDAGAADAQGDDSAPTSPTDQSLLPSPAQQEHQGAKARHQRLGIVGLCAIILALMLWQTLAADLVLVSWLPSGGQRGLVACSVLMLILLLASLVPRPADRQIIEEIEAERGGARRMALRESAWMLLPLVAGIAVLVLLRRGGKASAGWEELLRGGTNMGWWVRCAAGVFQALGTAVLAAGIGWMVRILGTLAFGKEAFGTGDIYIMAAVGAVAGLPLLVFAFFLGALLALLGVAVTLFRKTNRAVPFGPWLALGALVALWLEGPLIRFFTPAASLLWSLISGGRAGILPD
jgi:prepilin signal peptidase PulO-like enzyme (type II secretory pathway)